ncbi:MAG: hypothetical protein MZV70_19960 [Desulfobacterales bacterium]|nr:hypothetical protein [Desulfobacterales bacterium]
MGNAIHTLHDFMLRTEGITYILIVAALCGFIVLLAVFERAGRGRRASRRRPAGEHHH